jgi:general secretion pathway protein E
MKIRSENELVKELISRSIVEPSEIEKAYTYQKANGTSFIKALTDSLPQKSEVIYAMIADFLQIQYLSALRSRLINGEIIDAISAKIASRYKIIPVGIEKGMLMVCISDPFDIHMIDDLRTILNRQITLALAKESEIDEAINVYYGIGAGTIDVLQKTQKDMSGERVSITKQYEKIDDITGEASIVNFVNQILLDGYQSRATDIHIEPFETTILIRYRIDGVLHEIKAPHHIKQFQASLITRIKIISGLDISEHRLPQDGRIKIGTEAGMLDLRVSVVPTPYGESINIRILSSAKLLQLESLGFDKEQLAIVMTNVNKAHGIIFLTGPTGSGKTTTLYSALNCLNNRDKKIITVEDPIEYQIDGITQIQVHPKIGLDFGRGLRSILRHDPDIIMIGEVRDSETAEIAIRSALTGHLVLSTLHTNDAPSAIVRLIDMGIEPYLIASSLECVIAQRLVRVLCQECKAAYELSSSESEKYGLHIPAGHQVFRPKGCVSCSNTGYWNRTVVAEMMNISESISEQIAQNASQHDIKATALNEGMRTLKDDGCKKIMNGITSVDELIRIL